MNNAATQIEAEAIART